MFNEPANTFVATFIGSPTINLFDAELEPDEDGHRVPNAELEVPFSSSEVPAAVEQQSVQFGVRPQDLRPVSSRDEVDTVLSGTIDLVEPLGTDAIVRIQTAGGPVRAMIDAYESLDSGDELALGADVEDLYLFDSAGDLLKPRRYDVSASDEVTA